MSFTQSVTLPVGPDEAFALLTQPERLRRWQTVSAVVDLRAGGGYRWTVTPGHVAVGTFREVDPGRRIVFGWGWEGSDDVPPDASTITVTVEPAAEGGSVVTLTHEGLSEVETERHAEGWTHYLERLERVAATGDAGQDEWAWAPADLTPITASEAALAAVQPVLRGLTPEDGGKPTPCSEFDCDALVEHLIGGLVQLGAMAGGSVTAPADGTVEERVSVVTGQVIDLWRGVDLDGSVTLPGRLEMPPPTPPRSSPWRSSSTGGTSPRGRASRCTCRTRSSGTSAGAPSTSCPVGAAPASPTRCRPRRTPRPWCDWPRMPAAHLSSPDSPGFPRTSTHSPAAGSSGRHTRRRIHTAQRRGQT